jgi:predicted ABC-type ATPase
MLNRINELLDSNQSFAFETTLSTLAYTHYIKEAKNKGYTVTLLFLYLDSYKLAEERVKIRVKEGGHNIPKNIIKRRYERGLRNLFHLYIPLVDVWVVVDNSSERFEFIAKGVQSEMEIKNNRVWNSLKQQYDEG